jgi:hypothetical protein
MDRLLLQPPGRRHGDASAESERRRTRTVLLAVSAGVVVARLVFVGQPLRSDEGGYLFAARHWDPGTGEFIYGDFHVDRPPLLLLVYRVAALSEWDGMVRLLTIPVVLAAVLAVAWAGSLAAGWRGARWSAVVAGALLCSPALAADQADGELFAVPFVAASVAFSLNAWRGESVGRQLGYGLGAGALATAASLVKQNFLEGLVFAGVLLVADVCTRRRVTGRCVAVGAGFLGGVVTANATAYLWAVTNDLEPLRVWADLVTFRGQALGVIWSGSIEAPMVRAGVLILLGLVSMTLPITWTWMRRLSAHPGRVTPVEWAVTGMLLFGMVAITLGGSYWPHYLLELTVAVALAAGILAAGVGTWAQRVRRQARLAVGSGALAVALVTLVYAAVPQVWFQERTGRWLAATAAPGDTAFVAYGHASVLEAADLASPYPYLWSLPMRTLDPVQHRLRTTLAGADAPTWLIQINGADSWGIDRDGRLRELIERRYEHVAEVCGHAVLLRSDVTRHPAPLPRC